MDRFHVLNDTEGERELWTYEGYESNAALIRFLELQRYDRKVSLTYFGEEYEEE